MSETPLERAQIGVGTLVVFLSMVLVASVAAGVLINTTGVLEAMSQGQEGTTDRLVIVASTGTAITDGSVGRVDLTVTPGPRAEGADLRNTTVTWVGPRGAYNVVHAEATGVAADGRFRATALSDPNDSLPVLDDAEDRAILTFDLGLTDDATGVGQFGERLRPGDVVTVTVTSASGVSTTTRLAVPRTLSGKAAVAL